MNLYKIIFFSFTAFLLNSCQTNQDKNYIDASVENLNISNKIENNININDDSVSKVFYSYKFDSSNKIVLKKLSKKHREKKVDKLNDTYIIQSKDSIDSEFKEDSSELFESFEKISFKTNEEIKNDSMLLAQLYIPNNNYGLKINNILPPFYIYDMDSTKIFIYNNTKKYTLLILTDTSTCTFCNSYIESIRSEYYNNKIDTVLSVYNISLSAVHDPFMFSNNDSPNKWLYGWYNQYLPSEFDFKKKYNIEKYPIILLMDGEMRIININPNIEDLINLTKI